MSSIVDPRVFDFVDVIVERTTQGRIAFDDDFDRDPTARTFGESFFDQFFASIGVSITGFGWRSKQRASRLVEERRDLSAETRRLISIYESFCDAYDNLSGLYGGGSAMTYKEFHSEYLVGLLEASHNWAKCFPSQNLANRIAKARDAYLTAIEATTWLTTPRKRESVWQRLTSRRPTSS